MVSRAIAKATTHTDPIRLFVYQGLSVALDVLQTGHSCSLPNACQSPASVWLSSGSSCQACGGRKGFFGGQAGRSDQCDESQFCDAPMAMSDTTTTTTPGSCTPLPVSAAVSFTGFLNVSANTSSFVYEAEQCLGLQGTVLVEPSQAGPSAIPPFPLLLAFPSAFRSLLAVPAGSPVRVVAEQLGVAPSEIASVAVWLMATGPPSSRKDLYFVRWDTLTEGPQMHLNRSSSQACVVDHSQALAASCSFFIPRGSNKVSVAAAQTDFATNQMEVRVMLDGEMVSSSDVCGGAAAFGYRKGQQEQCDTYATCSDRFMYEDDSRAESNTKGTVSVTIPAHMRSFGCEFIAVVIATFEYVAVPSPTCAEYECPGERVCLPINRLCDGIQDCASNADEQSCQPLVHLPGEAFCVPTEYTLVYEGLSLEDCKRMSVANGSSIFTMSGTTCTVIISAAVPTVLAAAQGLVCPDSSADTYLYLPDKYTLGLCRDTIQCSNHGIAQVVDGSCTCTCRQGYYGEGCESAVQLQQILEAACYLEMVPDARDINHRQLEVALKMGSELVTISCHGVSPQGPYLRVYCSVLSTQQRPADEYVHFRQLLQPSTWASLNVSLVAVGQPQLHYISARTSMTPIVELPPCTWNGSVAVCDVPSDYEGLSLQIQESLPVLSATVTVIDYSNTVGRRGTQASYRSSPCTMASTNGVGGCVISACSIDVPGNGSAVVEVTDVVFGPATLLSGQCAVTSAVVSTIGTVGNRATYTEQIVANVDTNFISFLAGAIIIFVAGTVAAWATAAFFHRRYRNQYRSTMLEYLPDGKASLATPLENIKTRMLVRLSMVKAMAEGKIIHSDRLSSAFMTAGFVFAIGASLLCVYYSTAVETDSNFRVLYEEYTDSMCEQSPIASMPRRLFAVPADSLRCERMISTGEVVGQTFAHGMCEGGEGSYGVSFKLGPSMGACQESAMREVVSGACVHITDLDPTVSRNAYVRLTCSTSSLVSQREELLQQVTAQTDAFEVSDVTPLRAQLMARGPSGDGQPFVTPYLVGSTVLESTSFSEGVLVSQATADRFDGYYAPLRIVIQVPSCVFDGNGKGSCTAALEGRLAPNMSQLPPSTMAPLAPLVPDVPIGQLFGGYGTGAASTWVAAGPQAHRYYGIAGTAFDMGAHFPAISGSPEDEDGYAVSLWLRVDESTLGFAYAVTDALENSVTMQIYTLERLATILESGGGGAQWFNQSLSVYQALYVNGPGKSLTFAYASPNESEQVTFLEFDLREIGATRVMNGQWHHVAVTFIVENSKIRAQLVVDGQSSYTQPGWSNCVTTLPKPISELGEKAPVLDVKADRLTRGGLLAVGYFNGGVYRLQAHTGGPTIDTDLLPTGTDAMRAGNPFERKSTLALGIVLVAVAAVLLAVVGLLGTRDLRAISSASSVSEYRAVSRTLYGALSDIRPGTKLFGARIADSEALEPVCLWTALRWTKLTVTDFRDLLLEIGVQRHDASQATVLFLYQALTGDLAARSLTVAQWNRAVVADMSLADGRPPILCSFGGTFPDTDMDTRKCGGEDYFGTYFSSQQGAEDAKAESAWYELHNVRANAKAGIRAREVTTMDTSALSGLDTGAQGSSILASGLTISGAVVSVFQGVHVWATSIELPTIYNGYFSELFSFVSIDFAATFPSVPTLVTPLIQVVVGLSVLALVVYLVLEDDRAFETCFAEYVWRRDALEVEAADTLDKKLPAELRNVNVDLREAENDYPFRVLPLGDAKQLDMLVDGGEKSGLFAEIGHRTVSLVGGKLEMAATDSSLPAPIEPVGVRCVYHGVRLHKKAQTDIWPFHIRPACCVAVDGIPCGVATGKIYTCGKEHVGEDGVVKVCAFALCDAHCRQSLFDLILSSIKSAAELLKSQGLLWLACVLAVAAAGAVYTPFIKTALMVVGCHPYYQCEFERCWDSPDQKFALAAFLSITVLALFGLGYPLTLFFLLRYRKSTLETTFRSEEYGDKYVVGDLVRREEWHRFAKTDASALAGQYRDLDYKWLYYPPLMVLLKVLPLLPAVLMEPRTFDQRLGCAVVQGAIALFVFSTNAYLSPIVLMALRVSEVHQLLFLGLQNLDLVARNDSNGSLAISMVVVTLLYVIFSAVVFVAVLLYPVFDTRVRRRSLKALLQRHGLLHAATTTLYIDPTSDIRVYSPLSSPRAISNSVSPYLVYADVDRMDTLDSHSASPPHRLLSPPSPSAGPHPNFALDKSTGIFSELGASL